MLLNVFADLSPFPLEFVRKLAWMHGKAQRLLHPDFEKNIKRKKLKEEKTNKHVFDLQMASLSPKKDRQVWALLKKVVSVGAWNLKQALWKNMRIQ